MGWFSFNKKEKSESEEKEFCFIWYKKISFKNKDTYTCPFRTKIKAYSLEAAQNKLKHMIAVNTELVITEEKDFDKTDLSSFNKQFEKMKNDFNNIIDSLKF